MLDEQILFPEVKVGEILIKPWNFGILFELSNMLDEVLDKVNQKKLNIELFSGSMISYETIARLFTIASAPMLQIIAKTINKEIEEVKALSMEDGIKIAYIIIKQNWTSIKNVLTPLLINVQQTIQQEGELT